MTSDVGESASSFPAPRNHQFTLHNPGNFTITQKVTKDCNVNIDTYSSDIRAGTLQLFYVVTTTTATPTTTVTTTPTTTSATTLITTDSTTPPVTTIPSPVMTGITTAAGTIPATMPDQTTAGAPATAAQTAQAAPGTGTLSVVTTPSGAQVYVDDVLRGASPASVPGLSAGSHTIRLVLAGYQTMTVPVDINDGRTTEYSTALVPESTGPGMLPLVLVAIIILALAAVGGYLYMQKKKAP